MATSPSDATRAPDDLLRAIAAQRSEMNTLRRKLLRVTTQRDEWKMVAQRYRKQVLESKT